MTACRPFASHAVVLAGVVASFVCALSVAGCSHDSTANGPTTGTAGQLLAPTETGMQFGGARSLYPLAIGNRWDYVTRSRLTIVTDAGPRPPVTGEDSLRVEITGIDNFGRDYFVQKISGPGSDPLSRFQLVREDRSGLYQGFAPGGFLRAGDAEEGPLASELEAYVDRTVSDPAQRLAFQRAAAAVAARVEAARRGAANATADSRGPDPGELALLRFPLFVGARWLELEGSRYMLTVVDRERVLAPLGVFPAWKVRGTYPFFGPADRAYLWYGPAGLLRNRNHYESAAIDTSGKVVGRVVVDNDLLLTGLHLVSAGSPAGSN